ncbi:MAG: transcription antitermination factor NusB [Desulfovibrionales bacterium]
MSESKKGSRRKGRQKAFQCLYGFDFASGGRRGDLMRSFRHFVESDESVTELERTFALELVTGVMDQREEIDSVITTHSRHWRLERIAKVELAILRIAVYEMVYRPDIPPKVSINEAVELSKSFGDENSRSFINGILDAVARSVQG